MGYMALSKALICLRATSQFCVHFRPIPAGSNTRQQIPTPPMPRPPAKGSLTTVAYALSRKDLAEDARREIMALLGK
jgi:hypothetical protein